MTPVFIFSTPRAGSTLLQRILACHEKIATSPEPWILLPLLSMTKSSSACHTYTSSYSVETCAKAIKSFTSNINQVADKNNSAHYQKLLENFVLSLYQAASENNEDFFVDKTPRYYYIVNEIIKLLPHAKFIFLFRNPLQTYASVLTTWNNNNFFKLYRNKDDLYLAPKLLSSAYKNHQNQSIAINYDDLVTNTAVTLKQVFEYLNIAELAPEKLCLTEQKFAPNEMGDPTGQYKYKEVSANSINNWQEIINNPVRKWYMKRYLTHLGENVAQHYGYSTQALQQQVDSLPTQNNAGLLSDLLGIIYHNLVCKLKLNLIFSKKHNQRNSGFYD
ncbi:hypothetical protein GCM10009111_00690 [Colwellia asteriadis]|uniref:Sulfotransferase n=1 Tax=Colwellia asteriadis TaxID=517723 RepID=A0ABN1L241_9GAMM